MTTRHVWRWFSHGAATIAIALMTPDGVGAQQAARGGWLKPELRVDAIVARRSAVYGGVGAHAPLGTYLRLDAVVAAGTLFAAGGSRSSARADLTARFLLDPDRRRRRGAYAGAGLSAVRERGRTRGDILILVGAESRVRHGYAPAVEFGLGGGIRAGLVLRRARADRR